jgi:ankyrin repeat protein
MRQIDQDLVSASENGHTEVVQLLLNAGADVHAEYDAALRWASVRGHKEVIQLLLNIGADVYAEHDWAIRWASYSGHTEVVRLLLAHYRESSLKIPRGYENA